MPQRETLRVRNLQPFLKACDHAGKDTKKQVRGAFRKVGDIVKTDWRGRYRPVDAKSAAGLRTVVRQRGVNVEQSLRKTTGAHPEWGAWQLRHGGIPALQAKTGDVNRELEHAIDTVVDHFNTKGLTA